MKCADGLVVSMLELQVERFWVQLPARAEIWFEISAPSAPLVMTTLTIRYCCQDETAGERTYGTTRSHMPRLGK